MSRLVDKVSEDLILLTVILSRAIRETYFFSVLIAAQR